MARWNYANVLDVRPDSRKLWQFSASGNFPLVREVTSRNGEGLPGNLVAKNWRSIWQPKLNIAWLPSDKIFLRVVQLPVADFAETLAMVEMQLEKLSPLPVGQIVWTIEILPKRAGELQSIIVVIVPRSLVEEFLGQLETHGYLPDRLEVPLLDQLLATEVRDEGVWIYLSDDPETPCLVAWWYGGVLHNLTLLPGVDVTEAHRLRDQVSQMAWAGELEGWLTSQPRWHLVATQETAALWEPILSEWSGQTVVTAPPVDAKQLATLSAKRAARSGGSASLLPPEYSTRYHQRYIDRLWMRGMGALVILYLVGVVIYFSALQVLNYQLNSTKKDVAGLKKQHTEAVQLQERVRILEEQRHLKHAALDSWKASSDLLPQELTLTQINFQNSKLTVYGTVPQDSMSKLTDYYESMSKVPVNGAPMKLSTLSSSTPRPGPGGTPIISWSFACEIYSAASQPAAKKGAKKK
ncbi:MAG: hypothetical protein H0X66_17375 [Verrucomicrobia bacterium]|nr:hypothetical protein [Verrucomicrobiota bacterium]